MGVLAGPISAGLAFGVYNFGSYSELKNLLFHAPTYRAEIASIRQDMFGK